MVLWFSLAGLAPPCFCKQTSEPWAAPRLLFPHTRSAVAPAPFQGSFVQKGDSDPPAALSLSMWSSRVSMAGVGREAYRPHALDFRCFGLEGTCLTSAPLTAHWPHLEALTRPHLAAERSTRPMRRSKCGSSYLSWLSLVLSLKAPPCLLGFPQLPSHSPCSWG